MRAPSLFPFPRLSDLSAAAHGAHHAFDAAEGAELVEDGDAYYARLTDGMAELRRAAALLGFGLVPLDELPNQARVDAARLGGGEGC